MSSDSTIKAGERGLFITLEGGEGAGKTSNLEHILSRLQSAGHEVVQTREPGGTALGEHVREILLGHEYTGMGLDTETLLMFAARAEHIRAVILPALEAGKTVLCDRFTDATFAYQGGGRGVPMERIGQLESWVQGDLRPDFTILLDVPVDVGLKRAGQRSAPDRFESEQERFFHQVRSAYLERATAEPERFRVLDASQPLEDVRSDLDRVMDGILQC
ncbi:MAG: dTMP kinase [Gammaproteobacteria bacterium]